MGGRLIVVSGTGTSIGKTHVAEALLLALGGGGARACGLKPIETGVSDGSQTDAARLAAASSFHVKHVPYAFAPPVSPHLAARRQGVTLALDAVVERIDAARHEVDVLVVELAGGLFTPLRDDAFNADLAAALRPQELLLVAPDRLGVLHDVVATTRAASTTPLRITGLVLVTPERPDDSTGTNASELAALTGIPVVTVVPRGAPAKLAELEAIRVLVGR
ncbi:MAG TPA: dethiobiotin synthase [Polyangiaceae bacterium]|nr:dethiobiotin synthase [Polyangiaceae bacterium]